MTESQEDAAKAAILEKAMKGRQQADLMLRCKWPHYNLCGKELMEPSRRYGARSGRFVVVFLPRRNKLRLANRDC